MEKSQNVLICVTRQRSCERLIRVGYERSKTSGGKPYVIHVAPLGENFLGNPKEGEALDYLFDISKQVVRDAVLVLTGSRGVIKFFSKTQYWKMVLGKTKFRGQKRYYKKQNEN